MSLMWLDTITKKAMDVLHVLEFGLVIIDMDVSDGAWQHYQKCHGSHTYIGSLACDN